MSGIDSEVAAKAVDFLNAGIDRLQHQNKLLRGLLASCREQLVAVAETLSEHADASMEPGDTGYHGNVEGRQQTECERLVDRIDREMKKAGVVL